MSFLSKDIPQNNLRYISLTKIEYLKTIKPQTIYM